MPALEDLPFGARASMEPAGLAIEFRYGEDDRRVTATREVLSDFSCECADIACSYDGEVLEVSLVATEELFIESCRVTLRHAFTHDERVMLNGYQSWTDSVERTPWARMRGLKHIPGSIVEKFALDGLGDYRFTYYPDRPGRQHGFTYATFRRGEGLVLLGSLDESDGFTKIEINASRGQVVLDRECPRYRIEPGTTVVLCRCAITRGLPDAAYDRWFDLAGIEARPVAPLIGYTSWYRHYDAIDAEKMADDLAGAAAGIGTIDAPGAVKLFQIDDGYCTVGDWLAVDRRKFPDGLAPFAFATRRLGFMPGLWMAPFVCSKDSALFSECPEWLLRDELGNLVTTGSHWNGAYALDTRNPEVRSYILNVLQTATQQWGFKLLKLDFLYAACLVEHDGMNRGQLMADAVDLLRRGMGDDALMLACGVPLASVFGKADYCRIGCDVGLDWDDLPYMRLLHRERVSTKRSLANTYGRSYLDGRAFGNDPDVFFMRKDVRLNSEQREAVLFGDADLGSVLLTSDDMGAWSDGDKEQFDVALGILLARKGERGDGRARVGKHVQAGVQASRMGALS